MPRFMPSGASSPPRRPCIKPPSAIAKDVLDNSRASILSNVPELNSLTPDQVEFIDTVIQRASATATTFLSVFKAYNEVLQERGLDPQYEVVYYGKLLKLGTLKGKNWGEKWELVKRQQGNVDMTDSASRTGASRPRAPSTRAKVLTRLTGALKAIERDDDAFTLHSHQDGTDVDLSDAASAADTVPADDTPRNRLARPPPRRSVSPTLTTNSLGLSTVPPPASSYQAKLSGPLYTVRNPHATRASAVWDAQTSEAAGSSERASSTLPPPTVPPSYRAATRVPDLPAKISYEPLRTLARAHLKVSSTNPISQPPTHSAADAARMAIQQARQRRGSVLNEENAWKNIRMAQDEKDADQFREDKLVERCWGMWQQGYQWIITTNEQITQARDNVVLRKALQLWRQLAARRADEYHSVAAASDAQRLKLALQIWKDKFHERKQAKWRADMRARMKIVRDNRNKRLFRNAWAVWRRKYSIAQADELYARRLALNVFTKWKARKAGLEQLEQRSELVRANLERTQVARCWAVWRRAIELRRTERAMSERVELRMLANAFDAWKKRLRENQEADQQYELFLLRRTLRSWKAARDRLKALDRKAVKHVGRQNDVLVRAVWRVWKAHERGKLLERVQNTRLMRQLWTKWQDRSREQRSREDLAAAFSLRPSSVLAAASLQKWIQVYRSHRNAEAYAIRFNAIQLQYQVLSSWRLKLRAQAQQTKLARKADKFFILRDNWKRWKDNMGERRREQKLKEFEKKIAQRYFREWVQRAQAERERKLIGELVEQRVNLRIIANALSHWTTRVADLKFRELEVAQQNNREVMSRAFRKWKQLCIRHVEELSLMESYQDVKREEQMRRVFYRWLSAARKARTRRLLLHEKEEQVKHVIVARAWDKWRERYLAIRLQPMADVFLVRRQQYLMFRAFGIWHSKSTSLPAVRFHASYLKAKYWKIWRDSMPRALQSKKAREVERTTVLSKAFAKWVQAYKTKLELKAVARARYLRLPTAAPRQTGAPLPRPAPASKSREDSPLPILVRSETTKNEDGVPERAAAASTARAFPGRIGIASLLSERPRSPERPSRRARLKQPVSPSRPRLSSRAGTTRAASPARSTTSMGAMSRYSEPMSRLSALPSGGEIGRSQLWQELRGIQLRSRLNTESSRSKGLP